MKKIYRMTGNLGKLVETKTDRPSYDRIIIKEWRNVPAKEDLWIKIQIFGNHVILNSTTVLDLAKIIQKIQSKVK